MHWKSLELIWVLGIWKIMTLSIIHEIIFKVGKHLHLLHVWKHNTQLPCPWYPQSSPHNNSLCLCCVSLPVCQRLFSGSIFLLCRFLSTIQNTRRINCSMGIIVTHCLLLKYNSSEILFTGNFCLLSHKICISIQLIIFHLEDWPWYEQWLSVKY